MVTVELFGVPRVVAGQRSVLIEAACLGDVARRLGEACPALRGRVIDPATGWILDGYVFAVGERFTRDADQAISPGESVLLVASAAGG